MSAVRRVDKQGRIALPRDWRAKSLKEGKEVVVLQHDDDLIIRPRRRADMTQYFDTIEVDANPEDFADYALLRRALLTKEK